jgi:dUTP pyrophosphatase
MKDGIRKELGLTHEEFVQTYLELFGLINPPLDKIVKPILENKNMKVKYKRLNEGAVIPKKATPGSAAYDLCTAEDFIVEPGRNIIPLGFAMETKPGYEALIDPRSGFSSKGMEGYEVLPVWKYEEDTVRPIFLAGFPGNPVDPALHYYGKFISLEPKRFDCDVIEGKIDSDYRKGVGVIVYSRETSPFLIKAGTRISQMTFLKVETVEWEETDELSETDRDGGFGSTGTK